MSIRSFCGKPGFLILRTSNTYDSKLENTHTHTHRTEKDKGRTGHLALGCVCVRITTMALASLAVAIYPSVKLSPHDITAWKGRAPTSRVWPRAVSWRSPRSLGRTRRLEHRAASSQEARCHRQRLIYGRQKTADTSVICCTLTHVSTSLQWVTGVCL